MAFGFNKVLKNFLAKKEKGKIYLKKKKKSLPNSITVAGAVAASPPPHPPFHRPISENLSFFHPVPSLTLTPFKGILVVI